MVSTRWLKRALLALTPLVLFELLLVFRAPNLLFAPRFWAEEGGVFYAFAYAHGFFESLAFVYGKNGYFNLVTNVSTALAAHTAPPEFAPAVTVGFAWLLQTIPLLIVLYGSSTLFINRADKLVGCQIILLAPTVVDQIWLTTIYSQVFLGLATLLILFEKLEGATPLRRWSYRGLLVLGGLSGVYTVALQPLFVLKAWGERSRERVVQLGILCAALLAQIATFVVTLPRAEFDRVHDVELSPGYAVYALGGLADHILRPLLGSGLTDALLPAEAVR